MGETFKIEWTRLRCLLPYAMYVLWPFLCLLVPAIASSIALTILRLRLTIDLKRVFGGIHSTRMDFAGAGPSSGRTGRRILYGSGHRDKQYRYVPPSVIPYPLLA